MSSSTRSSDGSRAERLAVLQEKDRRACARDPARFAERHCTIEDPDGTVIPFALWDFQRDVLSGLQQGDPVIVLKARRLGLSWVVLAFALWLAVFQQGVRILILCKTEGDASESLDRIRRMLERLSADPASAHVLAGLQRPAKERDAVTKLDVGGSTIRALVGTPAAARSETAGLVIADEFAFQRRAAEIWRALLPTIEGGGRIAVISTGNGTTGDGGQFHDLWRNARQGAGDLRPMFFPWTCRPDRDEAWRTKQLALLGDADAFAVEYPLTEDDAFRMANVDHVYPPAAVSAAVELGRRLAAQCPPPDGGELHLGIDWGERTHCLVLHPLVGGGVFVRDEIAFSGAEPGAASTQMLSALSSHCAATGATPGSADYDAAGAQPMRTFRVRRDAEAPGLATYKVAFGSRKDETIGYLRRLFNRTLAGEDIGVIAIDPDRCPVLVGQLMELRFRDDDQGKVEKHNDHGPDALIAGMARAAARHRDLIDQEKG